MPWSPRSVSPAVRLSPPDPGVVHVWAASLNPDAAVQRSYRAVLSAEEVDRAEQYRYREDRRSFECARGVLRILLGRYLDIPGDAVSFSYGEHGKPSLVEAPDWSFNVSHSGEIALVAVAGADRVGIDIEKRRPLDDPHDLAERFFSDREAEDLRNLPDGDVPTAFFNAWTRKEAFAKATGAGLSLPLRSFDVTLVPGESPRLIECRAPEWSSLPWSIHALAPATDYTAALAVCLDAPTVECYRWHPSLDD